SPLSPFFRDPAIEKVFHAGEYDILCLKRDYGFEVNNIFDTMVAARTLGSSKLGLAPLIEQHFGVTLSKKLQRSDWGKRPLTWEHIDYARMDTHFLFRLRDKLREELAERKLLEEAREEFARITRIEPSPRAFDPDDFWRLPGARLLSAQARAVLRALYLYREKTAAENDRAPFRVMPEDLLVRIAEALPADGAALKAVKGMSPYILSRYGGGLLDQVRRGLAAAPIEKPPERPAGQRHDNETLRRYEALRAWRKAQGEKRGVNPVVILSTEEVRLLAQAPKESPDSAQWLSHLSDYKRELYGKDLLELLAAPLPEAKGRRRRRRRRKPAAPTA
ncbi:MAG TPA: HRDC domain-containing protein, partial [Elusimicrobiota bacterium]|nr:HRDC domain-containing protein [Elusimicrobiota bacterium]